MYELSVFKKLCGVLAALTILFGYCTELRADESDWLKPLGPPPKAAPRRISGGEAFPPLPLPVTPLRRSERKRQPSSPKIAAKVVWGESANFPLEDGNKMVVTDWNMCPGDLGSIVKLAGKFLGTPYSNDTIPLASFHGDPLQTPSLFFSGGRTVRFTQEQLSMLRSYVLRGGTLIFDSIAGSPYFYKSVKDKMKEAFPDYSIRAIPLDHPIYHIATSVDTATVINAKEISQPLLEGIYIGSRLGVIISRFGLGCGWDGRNVNGIKQATYYDINTARKIGVNIFAYISGYGKAAREEAKPEYFGSVDNKIPTDEFVFAQIKHSGAWNNHPGAAAKLLQRLRSDSAVRVSLKRVGVNLAKDDISKFPFLYLEGLDDFTFNDAEVAKLRSFFQKGGVLLINNSLGLKTFATAVKREVNKVLPGAKFSTVDPAHDLFNTAFQINAVNYSPAVRKEFPKLNAPLLEAVMIDNQPAVIYSPFDLAAGWNGMELPLAKAYEANSAMQLGMNLVVYSMIR